MNEYYGMYPENDYRYYLMHYAKGEEADDHKYVAKKRTKSGGIRYIYDLVEGVKKELSRPDRYDDMGNPPKTNNNDDAYRPLSSAEEKDDRKRRLKNAKIAMKKKLRDKQRIEDMRKYDRM